MANNCSQCGHDSGGYLCPLCLRPLCLDCSEGHTILCEACRVKKFRHSGPFPVAFPIFEEVSNISVSLADVETVLDHLNWEILSWESDYGDAKGALKVEPSHTVMVERPSKFAERLADALKKVGRGKKDA